MTLQFWRCILKISFLLFYLERGENKASFLGYTSNQEKSAYVIFAVFSVGCTKPSYWHLDCCGDIWKTSDAAISLGVVKPVGKQASRVPSAFFCSAWSTHSWLDRDGVIIGPFRLEKTLKVRSNCNGSFPSCLLLAWDTCPRCRYHYSDGGVDMKYNY